MIRLLITGTSQVAAIKGGWDRIAAGYAGRVAVEFFAMPAGKRRFLGFDGSSYGLVGADVPPDVVEASHKINGRDRVDLALHDHVLLVGWGGKGTSDHLARVLHRFDVDGLPPRARPHRLSQAALVAAMDDQQTGIAAGLEPWARVRPDRVSVMPPPRTLETALLAETPDKRAGVWAGLDLPDADTRKMLDLYDRRRAHALGQVGLRLVPKSDAVLGPSGFTAARFKAGAIRLAGAEAQPEDDLQHMNADYGAIVLRDFLETLLAESRRALSA